MPAILALSAERQEYCLSPEFHLQPGQHSETPSLQKKKRKKKNISWAWWHMPVVPATQEVEVAGLLEPRTLRLQWTMITSLHSNLGDKATPCLINKIRMGVMTWACNPSTLGGAKASGSSEVRSSRPAWPTLWNPISTKNTKISWAHWHVPVIPATQEAEAGASLVPRRLRLQWAEIMPLYSSLGNRGRLCLKKIKIK